MSGVGGQNHFSPTSMSSERVHDFATTEDGADVHTVILTGPEEEEDSRPLADTLIRTTNIESIRIYR